MRHLLLILAAMLATVIFSSCDTSPTYTETDAGRELEGTWLGYEISDPSTTVQLAISGNNYSYTIKGLNYYEGTFTPDTSVTPHSMDAYVSSSIIAHYNGKMSLSIYQLTADTLFIAGNEPGVTKRPSSFLPATGTAIYRLVRVSRMLTLYGDTIQATVDGPVVPMVLGPSYTVWVRFQAVEGTIYNFTRTGPSAPIARLAIENTTNLGSTVWISNSTRWTGQKTKEYYIKVTTDSSYVDTGVVTLQVHAIPAQASGDVGSYLCWINYRLARMDASSGTVITIGKSTDFFPILQYGPDKTLYGACTDLCVIDPINDKITVIGNFTYGSARYLQMDEGAMSSSGVLYVRPLSSDSIFTVDLSTAKLTFVGKCLEGGEFAFDGQDNMYVAYSELSRIDLPTFAVTSIGAFSKTQWHIAFTSGGRLMGMSFDSLYTINVTTARVSPRLLLGESGVDCFVEERPAANVLAKRRGGFSPHRTMEELEAMRQRHLEHHAH